MASPQIGNLLVDSESSVSTPQGARLRGKRRSRAGKRKGLQRLQAEAQSATLEATRPASQQPVDGNRNSSKPPVSLCLL